MSYSPTCKSNEQDPDSEQCNGKTGEAKKLEAT